MKKLEKLKLNALFEANLLDREMNGLRGGNDDYTECFCSCYWEGKGGSTTSSNRSANSSNNYHSVQGCNQYMQSGSDVGYCADCNESNNYTTGTYYF
jgi:natural product precursor